MKIVRVEPIPLRVPFASPFKISQGAAREMLDVLIVRVHTDEGLIGADRSGPRGRAGHGPDRLASNRPVSPRIEARG